MSLAVGLGGFDITGPVVALGVITGMIYGVLAVGLVLVHRANRIINFAHGEIGAFGAALLGVAVLDWDLPYWVAFVMAIAVGAAVGAASEILVVRRLRNAPVILSVIATLGLGQFLTVFSSVVNPRGGAGNVYPQPSGMPDFDIGALRVSPAYSTMLIATPLLVGALALFLRRGRLGIAMRASAANPDAARMAGILTDRMSLLAWAIAGAISAYTAVLILPTRGFTNTQILGPALLLRGLACAVIARMVSLPVALGVGIGLGTLEQLLLANYPTGGLVEAIIFVAILASLLLQRSRTGRAEDKGTWAAVQAWSALPESFQQVFAIRNLGRLLLAVGLVSAVVLQLFVSNATAVTLVVLAAFTTVGLSVGIVTGLAGQLSLGQFALGGVGATISYVVTTRGWGFVPGLIAAGVVAGAVSLVIGLPALRIRGLMLAVTTLSFALAAQSWLLEQSWMLGRGVTPRRPSIGGVDFSSSRSYYLVALVVLVVASLLAGNVWRSGAGRRLRAVRDNEDAARAFTVPAMTVKLQAFVLGGFIAGLGGAVYGHLLAQVGANAFPIDASINVAAIAVIGGISILAGPLLGALYIIGVPEFLPLDNAGLAATSFGWLVLILYLPGGLAQALRPVRDRFVDVLARGAGLDPERERASVPADADAVAAAVVALPAPPERAHAPGEPILVATGLVKRFGGVTAVDGVSLDIRAGETVGLIGPNGAGKTTLFELLAGFTRADSGSVTFGDTDISGFSPEQRGRLGLIRSFQDAALFPTLSVLEVVMLALERVEPTRFGSALLGLGSADRRKEARARELVGMMGLHGYRNSAVRELSTGTRRIAELASMIALEPIVLLLDEPTSGIAQRETEALGSLLARLKVELDLTLVIIEHDIPMIMNLSDRVVAMESGQVIADGSPKQVRENPLVIASYLGGDVRAIERSAVAAAKVRA